MTGLRTLRLALCFVALVAALDVADAQTAKEPARELVSPKEPTAEPSKEPAKELRAALPIVFFVAKGEPDSCGPGCSEWIAADGKFDAGAPARLRAVLAKLGKRKLPVYFESPGGAVDAAMEIGRIMRSHKMKAGVARSIAQGCDPKQRREKACEAIMRSGRELNAELRSNRAVCASACVYAVIGAAEREIAPDAALGIHSVSVTRTMTLKNREGKILAMKSTRLPGDSSSTRDAHGRIARYAAEMGISQALIDAAAAVPFEKIRALKRDEIARFNIDARGFAEGRWLREEDKSGRTGLLKFAADATEPNQFRTSLVRLSCTSSSHILVQLARERATTEKFRSVSMRAAGSEIVLTQRGQPSTGESSLVRELRTAFTTRALLEDAARGEGIEIVAVMDGAAPGTVHRMTLSTLGLAPQLSTLGAPCF